MAGRQERQEGLGTGRQEDRKTGRLRDRKDRKAYANVKLKLTAGVSIAIE